MPIIIPPGDEYLLTSWSKTCTSHVSQLQTPVHLASPYVEELLQ